MDGKREMSPDSSETLRLFDATADRHRLQSFSVKGLKRQAVGTVYLAGSLEQGGMPLGGLATGYICLDTDGRFGKASIFNHYPAPMRLDRAFLSLTAGDRRFILATPAASGAPEGAGHATAIHYFGHFPIADVRFEVDAPFDVELRCYGPFLPGDAVACNTPAVVFEVYVRNRSTEGQHVALTFAPDGFPTGRMEPFSQDGVTGVQVTHAPMQRMPGWVRHTYALAADGVAQVDPEPPGVTASRNVEPGETATYRFILACHQPYLREASGRVEQHIYATRFADAKAVVAAAIASHQDWLRRILAWQDVLYGADLPDWLREALVNTPYALTKNSLWLARTRPDDWWSDAGLWLVNESFSTCSVSETMPCRFFGHWPALFFFPELERITLKAIRHFQLRDGEPPFCLGLGFAIRDPRYHCQHTCGAGEYAQMIYRYYLRTGDRQFLGEFWESACDAIDFMMRLDTDGDGLVEDHPHTIEGEFFPANNPLDTWPWRGVSSYTAGKGLAALTCGIAMAETVGDKAQAEEWRRLLKRGQNSFEEKLWAGSYYRHYNDTVRGARNDASFSAQLSCVWCTRVLGLEDPLPPERIQQALATIAKLNIPASPFGMVDAVFPDGRLCVEGGPGGENIWSRDIFIQCNATAAMVFLYAGERPDGERAARMMLDTIFRGPHPMPWAQPCGVNSQTGKSCHGHDYYDHMVVWSYPLAFAGVDIRTGCAPGGLIDAVLKAACS